MPALLQVPAEGAGLPIIASVSGGKDSTESMDAGALFGSHWPPRYVFADTGWEAPETYEYLDVLRNRLGIRIDVVEVDGGMRARIRVRAGFPGRTGR